MAVTTASFKTLFPEFIGQDDTRVQLFLDQASRRIDLPSFGPIADDTQSYLTAHLLATATQASNAIASGARGPVASESVGPLSRSYQSGWTGAGSGIPPEYSATQYGVQYWQLVNQAFPTPTLAY